LKKSVSENKDRLTKIGFQNQEHLLKPNEVTHALEKYYNTEKDCINTMEELQHAIKAFPLISKSSAALVDLDDIKSALMD
jgi:hypothetical protein